MRTLLRNLSAALLFWGVLFSAMILLFQLYLPGEAEALADEKLSLTVLTEEGPVVMTMAEYLPGAVAAEMPVSFGEEALRAQAVAARTYVLASSRHSDGDICTDSACCLAWSGEAEQRKLWGPSFEENLRAVTDAVRRTDGQYLTYGGRVIQAVFHASSAGATEDSGAVWSPQPYLISVESPETADSVPGLLTTVSFSPEELAGLLAFDADAPPDTWITGLERDEAGRVKTLYIGGQALSGTRVRGALALRSTDFTVSYYSGSFVFTVAGNGHGVGMSQYGAKLLADRGWTYDSILAHYYPGTELNTP